MKNILIIIIGVVVIIGGALFFAGNRGEEQSENHEQAKEQAEQKFNKAPELGLQDFDGNTIRLADFKDKEVLVINSWAVWCPFCKEEIPDFVRLQEEFGDRIAIVAVDRGESEEKQKGFIEEREQADGLEIDDALIFVNDPSDSYYKKMGGIGMPVTIFVDGEGNIRSIKQGSMPLEEMRQRVEEILNPNP